MSSYQIGQYRFGGSGCVTNVNNSIGYQDVSMGETTESTSTSFKDVIISPDTPFIKDRDYYLSIAIPQDMNYDMAFNLKLIKKENNSTTVYQFLKNITITRGGTGENAYNVVLYEKSDKSVAAMIPLKYQVGTTNTKDLLYYDSVKNKYYLGNGGTSYTETHNFNELSVVASWKQEIGNNFGVFELTFRPVEDSFTQILLEMVRTAEDYNIQRANESGQTEFGRKVDISKVQYTLYSLTNLVDYMNKDKSLSRIGVWGHSGLMMTINGEEIKVGPSGYYELDAIEIISLGIVAEDNSFENNFTIDYSYNNDTNVAEIGGE